MFQHFRSYKRQSKQNNTNTNASDAIKASVKNMNSEQLGSLFSTVADARGVIVICASYREDIDMNLIGSEQKPLCNDEWKQFSED